MSSTTIAAQVDDFNPGFTTAVGPENAAAFAEEQAGLHAAGVPVGAVTTGDRLPEAELVTADGATTSLAEALGGRTTVLVLFRGVWCPYCNIALRTYQRDLLPELDRRGVALVAISPQTPEATARTGDDWGLTFPLLGDPGNALAARLGVLTAPSAAAQEAHTRIGFDVADSNADATRAIPFPTVLLVDADGVVRFADVHVDYTTRTEVPEILAAIDRL